MNSISPLGGCQDGGEAFKVQQTTYERHKDTKRRGLQGEQKVVHCDQNVGEGIGREGRDIRATLERCITA